MKCCNCGAFVNSYWGKCQLCDTPRDEANELLPLETLKKYADDDEWEEIVSSPQKLAAFSGLIDEKLTREKGLIPKTYTATVVCAKCGEVPIDQSLGGNGYIQNCPWCLNRRQGLPIPTADQIKRTSGDNKLWVNS